MLTIAALTLKKTITLFALVGPVSMVPLFLATACGIGVGAVQPFRRVDSLRQVIPALSARLAAIAAVSFLLFTAVATIQIVRSNLVLLGS